MKTLKSFMPNPDGFRYLTLRLVEGVPLTIRGYSKREGKYGTFYVMTASDESGQTKEIIVSSPRIMRALDAAKEADAFPVEATFIKTNGLWGVE